MQFTPRVYGGIVEGLPRTIIELNRGTPAPVRLSIPSNRRNGITTFVEFGSQLKVQEALDAQVNELGIRAYLGPGFDSGRWVGGPDGRLTRVVDEAAGERELALALDFIERRAGAHNDRLGGILVPREVETCTPALLRAVAREAHARKLPVAIHAAYNVHEFFDIIREHRKTSIELLEEVGLMSSSAGCPDQECRKLTLLAPVTRRMSA